MKAHLHCGDFSACGRCGPKIYFVKTPAETTCKICLSAIVVNLNDPSDWRLKVIDPEKCQFCGCTEDKACRDSYDPTIGCHWVAPGICSECTE